MPAMIEKMFVAAVLAVMLSISSTSLAWGADLHEIFLRQPSKNCDLQQAALLREAETSYAAGGNATGQAGWTDAHIDLMRTNASLLSEIAREYALAGCWNDVERLVSSSEMSDEILVRVAYQFAHDGNFAGAEDIAALVGKKDAQDSLRQQFVKEAVRQGNLEVALEISKTLAPWDPRFESAYFRVIEELSAFRRHGDILALAARYGSNFGSADWIWVAGAEARTGKLARARSRIKKITRSTRPADRDFIRMFASAVNAEYFPKDAVRSIRLCAGGYLCETIFSVSIRRAKSESTRKRLIAAAYVASKKKPLETRTIRRQVAKFESDRGNYALAYRMLQCEHCRIQAKDRIDAYDLEALILSMACRGDVDLALSWALKSRVEPAYIVRRPVAWALAQAGRSGEALALLGSPDGEVLSPTLLPAIAAVLPNDSPFEAWLDFAISSATPAVDQDPALQALSAAFTKAKGELPVQQWLRESVGGFQRTRVLVGIAQGRRGVIPGRVRPSYWMNVGDCK